MTRRPRPRVRLWGLAPCVAVAVLSLYRPSFLSDLENWVYDLLVRSAQLRPPDNRVVIVDIDERSLSAVGQWPWRRDIVADLVTRLRDLGASTVALDIVFAESDRYQATAISTDAVLADTLRAGRVVLGYALTFDGVSDKGNACVKHPIGLALISPDHEQGDDSLFRATGAICSLPVLTQAAGASGFLNAAPDSDGILRRVPLLIEFADQIHPSLALAAVNATRHPRDIALRVVNVNTSSLLLDGQSVPLDGKGNLLVRYRGPKRTFPYVSAADVLSGAAHADAFNDKLVFVGTTALGTREVVATPLDTLFAGVEVQATVADNLLQGDVVRRPEFGITVESQVVLGLGLLAVFLVGRVGLFWASIAAALSLAVVWFAAVSLLSAQGMFLSPLYPSLGLTFALATMVVVEFTFERRRADRAIEQTATSQRLMIRSLVSLTSMRDAETGHHSRRTQHHIKVLAEELAKHPRFRDYLTPATIELLSGIAPLHDIGKVGVPDRLLNKPGALTAEEIEEMRKHPGHGRDVLVRAEEEAGAYDDAILAMAKEIVYTHHERWDGTGYPQGLRGDAIPIPGRIMAVVDVYDATVSRRLYHAPMSHDEAVALIVRHRGTHFDPDIVDAFLKVSETLRGLSADEQRPAV